MQPPSAAEHLPSDVTHHASEDEEKLPELSYEEVFQFFNNMYASRGADVVTPEPADSWDGELFESSIRAAIESAAAAETARDSASKPAEWPRSPAKPWCRKRGCSSRQGKSLVRDPAFFRGGQDSCSETLAGRGDHKS